MEKGIARALYFRTRHADTRCARSSGQIVAFQDARSSMNVTFRCCQREEDRISVRQLPR